MPINHDPLQKAFETIRDVEVPSEQQKEKMQHSENLEELFLKVVEESREVM